MEKLILRINLLVLLICSGLISKGVTVVGPVEPETNVSKNNNEVPDAVLLILTESKKELKKATQKERRFKRKMQRIQKRLAKWADSSKKYFGGATDNSKFRLGFLCLLAGIGFAILANIIGLGWLLGGLGGLVALIGIILMIWGVLEYTN